MTINILQALPTELRDNPRAQSQRIASAYGAVFSGNGTVDDADLVLVDLAQFTRYYDTASLSTDPHELAAAAQRRAVFQRIMDALAVAGKEPRGLLGAVMTAPEPDATEEISS
jgi:hypothetical protein